MKSITIFLISFLVISCKTNSKLVGEYRANLSDSIYYTFNFTNKQYMHKWTNGTFSKGKFKILDLSSKKKFLVCDELIYKRANGGIKETNVSGDSINVGTYFGYQKLGQTVFEITSTEKTLLYRKTYTDKLEKTDCEGILVKK